MTLQLLTIPDDPQAWPQWLTARFCSGQLPLLVQELHLLGGPAAADQSVELDAVLSPARQQDVAENGLQVLSTAELQRLFAQPDSLLQLHGYLCLCGGSVWSSLWDSVPDADKRPAGATAAQLWQRAAAQQLVPAAPQVAAAAGTARFRWQAKLTAAVAAAAVLLAVFLWPQNAPQFSLRSPALLAGEFTSPQACLNELAAAGNLWFDQHPRNSQQLGALLRAVSRDCQLLIENPPEILAAAPLTPKAPGDPDTQAAWFVAKCRKWKGDFDATLAQLESGQLNYDKAQAEADRIMMKLVTVLQAGPA